jgi:hypothetical protein
MFKRIVFGLAGMVMLYFAGLFGCLWLLPRLTENRHDSEVEAAMTGAFIVGPLLGLIGLVAGALLGGPSRSSMPSPPDPTRPGESRPLK